MRQKWDRWQLSRIGLNPRRNRGNRDSGQGYGFQQSTATADTSLVNHTPPDHTNGISRLPHSHNHEDVPLVLIHSNKLYSPDGDSGNGRDSFLSKVRKKLISQASGVTPSNESVIGTNELCLDLESKYCTVDPLLHSPASDAGTQLT